jgi:hypothetical protein
VRFGLLQVSESAAVQVDHRAMLPLLGLDSRGSGRFDRLIPRSLLISRGRHVLRCLRERSPRRIEFAGWIVEPSEVRATERAGTGPAERVRFEKPGMGVAAILAIKVGYRRPVRGVSIPGRPKSPCAHISPADRRLLVRPRDLNLASRGGGGILQR